MAIGLGHGAALGGEIVGISEAVARAMTYAPLDGAAVGDAATLLGPAGVHPAESWVGRIVDAFGQPLDGRPLAPGAASATLRRAPPPPATRKGLGLRLATGLAVFDTVLPIARGQRIGVFAGSGIGKSSLLADLARGIEAEIVVYALIGERGRELRDFVDNVLGPKGMERAVVVAATSDQAPLIKRRAAWMAMATAEVFRDQGRHVLLLIDSLTRFAEAHREIALTAGEAPSLRGFPPSTANLIAALCERAGPGPFGKGDITGVFSVLVAASDMDEPIADITRGVLDGHVVLDRGIAERGRFPAIDVRRSVSRSLPAIATPDGERHARQGAAGADRLRERGADDPDRALRRRAATRHRRGDPALAEARRLLHRAGAGGGGRELRPAGGGAGVGEARSLDSDSCQARYFFSIEAPSVYLGSTMLPRRTRPAWVQRK